MLKDSGSALAPSDADPGTPRAQFPTRRPRLATIPLDGDEPVMSDAPSANGPAEEAAWGRQKQVADKQYPEKRQPDYFAAPSITGGKPIDPNQDAQAKSVEQAVKSHPLADIPQSVPEWVDFAKPVTPSNDPLERKLQKRARENPRDIAAQLDIQLYAMLRDDPHPELATVTLLPHEDRELINVLIDGLCDFRTAVREDATLLQGPKIRPLVNMADSLRSQAGLSIPTATLCRKVRGFGEYEPFDPPRFPAGRENQVIVYAEVENFVSKRIQSDLWETNLTQKVELFTDTGQLVWPDKPRPVTDQSRRRRKDFYVFQKLALPPTLTIGRYLLMVTITDENSGSMNMMQETVPLEIGATIAEK